MKRTLVTAFLLFSIIASGSHLCLSQTIPSASRTSTSALSKKQRKIKNKVGKIGVGGKITVIKLDKNKFYGKVSKISDETFTINEVDLKTPLTFKYADINKIHKGDGEKHLITGKRNNPQKGWLWGLAIFGALAVIIGVTVTDKDF